MPWPQEEISPAVSDGMLLVVKIDLPSELSLLWELRIISGRSQVSQVDGCRGRQAGRQVRLTHNTGQDKDEPLPPRCARMMRGERVVVAISPNALGSGL